MAGPPYIVPSTRPHVSRLSIPSLPPTFTPPIPIHALISLTLFPAASLLHFGIILYSSSIVNIFTRFSTSPSSLAGGVDTALPNQLSGRPAGRSASGVIVPLTGNVFVLSFRNLGNQADSLLLSDDEVVGRVGDGHGEAHVDARLKRTMSAMLFLAKSVEVSGPGILAEFIWRR
jgi:hypothetical protein